MPIPRSTLRASLPTLLLAAPVAAQQTFADWQPLGPGYSWKYVNTQTGSFAYWDVLAPYPYGGNPGAMKLGDDLDDCLIVANDGVAYTLLAAVGGGVVVDFPDVVLGSFQDGLTFSFTPFDQVVLREWSALDPAALATVGAYGVDPALPDAVVWVWYSKLFPPNPQNAIVESGGGVAYPWAVTDLEWFRKDLGPAFYVEIEADAGAGVPGTVGDLYLVTASFDCNGNGVQDHLDISTGASADCNANELPDECEPALEVVRLGTPPNPFALLPGTTGGPVLGTTWAPVLDHTAFVPAAIADFLGLSATARNVPTAIGTLLLAPPTPGLTFVAPPGTPFAVPIPPTCTLLGLVLTAQGGSLDASGGIALANALDLTLGSY